MYRNMFFGAVERICSTDSLRSVCEEYYYRLIRLWRKLLLTHLIKLIDATFKNSEINNLPEK
ncbi:TPA: hypothetical protein DIV55_00350 [Patescibacteria group bacterium]|nr:hypothetical protein [Patescibacteria group bacterium]